MLRTEIRPLSYLALQFAKQFKTAAQLSQNKHRPCKMASNLNHHKSLFLNDLNKKTANRL